MKKYINLSADNINWQHNAVHVDQIRANIIQQFENEFLLLQVHHKSHTELDSCRISAQRCSIPTSVLQHLVSIPRESHIIFHPHRIPVTPVPMQVTTLH